MVRLVELSHRRNQIAEITGALMFTEANFVQFIEGPPPAVAALMQRLRSDSRHSNVDVIQDRMAAGRRFEGWGMAYLGPAIFLENQMQPLLSRRPGDEVPQAAGDLIELMQIFASASRPLRSAGAA